MGILRIPIHTVEYTGFIKYDLNSTFGTRDTNYINPYSSSTYGTLERHRGDKYELNHIIRIISNIKNIWLVNGQIRICRNSVYFLIGYGEMLGSGQGG